MKGLKIIYEFGIPFGIRDQSGYLFFFREITKYSGQDERYCDEIKEQCALANYLLGALAMREEVSDEKPAQEEE